MFSSNLTHPPSLISLLTTLTWVKWGCFFAHFLLYIDNRHDNFAFFLIHSETLSLRQDILSGNPSCLQKSVKC